jgi:formylglycine-generating enzyme required for sulfatase activity
MKQRNAWGLPVGHKLEKRAQLWRQVFGLYDMLGNVWEWVQDWYHDSYEGAPSDGSAWESPAGEFRVIRGGSWASSARAVRSASRGWAAPTDRYNDLGFRVARSLP